jgi:hypothetical protein
MRSLWRQHPWAPSGFALATLVTLFFLVRLAVQAVYWSDPAHRNMVPQPWMTVGYIGRSWGLDPAAIDRKAGFPSPVRARAIRGPWPTSPVTAACRSNRSSPRSRPSS